MERFVSFFGLLSILGLCFLLSDEKKSIAWRTIISGVLLQIALGLFILKTDLGVSLFSHARDIFTSILDYTNEGSAFLFGSLSDSKKVGFVFATMVLPTIIFTSALMSVLYHLGVMQFVVKIFAFIMAKVMKTSGAESLSSAANIFAGQTEAPLVVKPFIPTMTRSELLALMSGGMATVAGGVLAAYVGFGIDAAHLLAASVMSAPAALVCAKLLIPEMEESKTLGTINFDVEKTTSNVIDAAAAGAADGLKLALNVGAMLLAFIALIALINGGISWFAGLFGHGDLSLEMIMGYVFFPVAFLLGVPFADCSAVGSLLGKKIILNEFVAYLDLVSIQGTISNRAMIISTYALCGFANFSSIAIQVGGIGVLAPSRKKELAALGIKSLIAGTSACLMTACIAGMLL